MKGVRQRGAEEAPGQGQLHLRQHRRAGECVAMLLFWRIRYLDTRDKAFKDRDLWLDTTDCTFQESA
jgi:hypothetical protein